MVDNIIQNLIAKEVVRRCCRNLYVEDSKDVTQNVFVVLPINTLNTIHLRCPLLVLHLEVHSYVTKIIAIHLKSVVLVKIAIKSWEEEPREWKV